MLIESSSIAQADVYSADQSRLGKVDEIIIDGKKARIAGMQVQLSGLIKKFAGLNYLDVLEISRHGVIIDNKSALNQELKDFDTIYKNFGPGVGVTAKTESGKGLGKVTDLLFEAETGIIVRFYLKNMITERIIPREYLVSITPKQVVFKDIVDQPIFDSLVTQGAES